MYISHRTVFKRTETISTNILHSSDQPRGRKQKKKAIKTKTKKVSRRWGTERERESYLHWGESLSRNRRKWASCQWVSSLHNPDFLLTSQKRGRFGSFGAARRRRMSSSGAPRLSLALDEWKTSARHWASLLIKDKKAHLVTSKYLPEVMGDWQTHRQTYLPKYLLW